MNTAIISAEINSTDIPLFEAFLKKVKAKSIKIEEKDPTKMSREEFFAKINRARDGKKYELNIDNFRQKYGI